MQGCSHHLLDFKDHQDKVYPILDVNEIIQQKDIVRMEEGIFETQVE